MFKLNIKERGFIKKVIEKNPIHPLFLFLFIWFLVCNKVGDFFIFVFVLLIHELSHFVIAKRLGYKLNRFYLTPNGAELDYQSGIFTPEDEIKIALAGPVSNIFLAIFLSSIWWVFPECYVYTKGFVFQSVCLGLVNLLPAFPLDGGRVIFGALSKSFNSIKVLKWLKISNLLFALLFLILFVFSCFTNFNPSLILMTVFLLTGMTQTGRESKYNLLYFYKTSNKNFSKSRILNVKRGTKLFEILKKIEKNKHTIFYIELSNGGKKLLPEERIINLGLMCDLTKTIDQIIQK